MKKIIYSVLGLSLVLWSIDPTLGDRTIPCPSRTPTTEAAEKCVKNALAGSQNDLLFMANSKGHLGDVADCIKTEGRSSYFAGKHNNLFDFAAFGDTFTGANVEHCTDEGDKYYCEVNLHEDACYIPAPSGVKGAPTKVARFVVSKSTKNPGVIVSFYPYR